jgi:hypothetical protein
MCRIYSSRKNLSKNNSKSLATLRQKLRKYIKEKDYDVDMAKFRENPDLPDEDEEKGTLVFPLELVSFTESCSILKYIFRRGG